MKEQTKMLLWVILGVMSYIVLLLFGVLVLQRVNLATLFWGTIFPILIVISSTGSIVFCFLKAGGLLVVKKSPKYDLNLLKHEVINQLEADFNDKYYKSMNDLFQTMIDNGQHELLYDFIGESAQENLNEGLTVKRDI